jgi:hypothetical protein
MSVLPAPGFRPPQEPLEKTGGGRCRPPPVISPAIFETRIAKCKPPNWKLKFEAQIQSTNVSSAVNLS